MAKSLISPFPPPLAAAGRLPGRESALFRSQDRAVIMMMKRNKIGENAVCRCVASNGAELDEFCRRDLLLLGVSSYLIMAFPNSGLCEETEEVKMESFVDEINAYTYLCPMQSKKQKFKWAESRKPERYSSAAPLSPDARLRIVSERVDFVDNLIISVSIGPPNLQFLKSMDNPELREKVMSGAISPARLCSMSAEELASKELSEWRIAKAEEFEQMKILPDSDIDIRRLVKKTHKGEFQVEVEEDDVSVEVSLGSSSFQRIPTEAKETMPQSGQKSNGGQKKTIDDKANSEEQNPQCTITIPSNESSDLMQGLIEDDMKDAEFLPPIVSLDEFMESLHSEPPFENLPPDADKKAASPDNDHAEVPSDSKSAKLSPEGHTSATSGTPDSLDTEDPKVDTGIKPTNNQQHTDISPPVVLSKGEHIWEGSLQLTISSTIAVSGFFKRGEKASTKDWPRTMEIKGRVRLDAFEKFLQDLYKSQSRSIMVVHVILKEDKEKEAEALSQVVGSYVADDRVGFAEPLRGLEVYLCPNHPKILDRIEKHLVKDQTEALSLTGDDKGLIGVVVSRKANASPNSSSHHKHGLKKHQQEHYSSSRRHNHRQDRNINVNSPNLTPKYPVVPLVSSKATYSAPPVKAATDEDDVPPGFGPRASQDDDDLPEFNFSGGLSRSVPTQMPIGFQPQNRPADQMRQLVQKYGQTAANAGSGKHWKDEEDDIPKWHPQVLSSPAPQPTPPLNQPMLQHLINQQQQLLRSPYQAPQPLQPPMPAAQHNSATPGWPQSGVWLNHPQGPQQGQFYGAHSRGF